MVTLDFNLRSCDSIPASVHYLRDTNDGAASSSFGPTASTSS
jgi:hypothetical protein